MTYTKEQKELLLDRLFDGVVCFNIYNDIIDIIHPNRYISYYNSKLNKFYLSWDNIWFFFESKEYRNYEEIKDLTCSILRYLTKRNTLTTFNLQYYELYTTAKRTTT